ncbi:MAG: prephenate dehydratase [Phycisphaerales bacterium]|nr:prephenate dehydratase [Phycisphaerales bacterium]
MSKASKAKRVRNVAAGGRRDARPTGGVGEIDLAALRVRIDAIDRQLVELLNARSALVVDVGRYKRAHNVPIYAPHREQEVLSRVLAHNAGPLGNRTIEGVYRELMSGSFALEKPLAIGFLGPAGSYSHLAAVKQFGSSVAFEDLHEIAGVFTEVERAHVDYGIVPIENSIHGSVTETLDSFANRAGKINIYAEVQLDVRHALLANCEPKAVMRIYSKPEVFSQCRGWLATQYPKAEQIAVASSSRAVQMVAEEAKLPAEKRTSAAIGSTLAGELYGVNILFEGIQDEPNNITRFVVISREKAQPSGGGVGGGKGVSSDKTSIMFTTLNKPGALVKVLGDFHAAGVNLTHIDKRPSRRDNWTYTFFIDAEGHQSEKRMGNALARARKHCKELHVLGSYPRSRRIL